MSVNANGRPTIAAEHGKLLFSVLVYEDGTVTWTGPKSGDPMTDELLLRGWFDKTREIALGTLSATSLKSPLSI